MAGRPGPAVYCEPVIAADTGTAPAGTGIRGLVWRPGGAPEELTEVEQAIELARDPSVLVWLEVDLHDNALFARLATELGFDPRAVDDSRASRGRPKASRFAEHNFCTLYDVWLAERAPLASRVRLNRISAFVLDSCLVTVRAKGRLDADQLVDRWLQDPQLATLGVDGLLAGLLDLIIDRHYEVLQQLDDGIEALEDDLFADLADMRALQRRTYLLRRELVELRRVIVPMRDVITTVMHTGQSQRGWTLTSLSYYEDLTNHALRAAEWTEALRDLVSSIHETTLSINDTRMNVVMKKLAGWAAIIAVPTLITGWFGMNVPYPGFGRPVGYWVALGLVLVSAVVLFWAFRRRDWL